MDITMIGLLAIMGLVFFGLSSFSKRANQRRQDERERILNEEMVPGVWVHTKVGFYGRFVDMDGDVVILETPSGEETYWNKMVVQSVGDLPFAFEEHTDLDDFGDMSSLENEEDLSEMKGFEVFEDEKPLNEDDKNSKE